MRIRSINQNRIQTNLTLFLSYDSPVFLYWCSQSTPSSPAWSWETLPPRVGVAPDTPPENKNIMVSQNIPYVIEIPAAYDCIRISFWEWGCMYTVCSYIAGTVQYTLSVRRMAGASAGQIVTRSSGWKAKLGIQPYAGKDTTSQFYSCTRHTPRVSSTKVGWGGGGS